ncbi:MAG TPA: phosphohistidine phosphatase SixA [Gammaproteobacteria bacterium]|nr:phosphohistidine phosphatase SixA [Gammaproteobacteria bacterium]
MKLYLVQHGQALTKDVDPGRPLHPQGEEEVRRVAEFLGQTGMTVDRVVHSGKMRAHQTADILANALLINGEAEAIEGINPQDPVQDFSKKVSHLKHDTMVVGHLPFMARMVSYLVTGHEQPAIVAYKPGSIVCLQPDEELKWQIHWMVRPDTLKIHETSIS